MLEQLDTHTIGDGSRLTVTRISGPEADWAPRISPFLSHKGELWNGQISDTLTSDIAPLEANYYVGLVDGEIAGNVCTFEYRGVGILGHVFTSPSYRRKGVCRAIMGTQMNDFRNRGGSALHLGTGYGSTAARIYGEFGFRPIAPESGAMEYYVEDIDAFESSHFAPGSSYVRESDWRDWPGFACLTWQRAGSAVRSVALSVFGRKSMGGPYLELRRLRRKNEYSKVRALEVRDRGAVVGMSLRVAHPHLPGSMLSDLFVHPEFSGYANALLAESVSDDVPIYAVVPSNDGERIAAYEANGFSVSCTMPHQVVVGSQRLEMLLLSR